MAGCGYVCPKCEGRGFTDDGEPCDWCSPTTQPKPESEESEIEDAD